MPRMPIYGHDGQDEINCPNCKATIGYTGDYAVEEKKYCSNCIRD